MSNLNRRLRNLEARLTDSSGLVPHSQVWRDYWFPKVDRMLSGQEPAPPGSIPLEVVDAILAADRDIRGGVLATGIATDNKRITVP